MKSLEILRFGGLKKEGRRRKFIEALLNIRNPILTKEEAGY